MNSEGCRLATPSDNQRRAPFTSRPTCGISTSTSATMPHTNSHGDRLCQVRIDTWNAISAAIRPVARNSAWRTRKYVGCLPVKRLASAVAIEAEYTMTIPSTIRISATHASASSNSADELRSALMKFSMREASYAGGEHFAAMRIVAEHVETGAGRRQQHGIARMSLRSRLRHRLLHARG